MSNCQDDLTAVDVELTPTLLGRVSAGSSEVTNLFSVIDRDNIHGLNLTVPEDAKEVIKPWDTRESLEKWIESGEDDEVWHSHPPWLVWSDAYASSGAAR